MNKKTSLSKIYSSGKNGHMGRGSRPVTVTVTEGDVVTTTGLYDVEKTGFTWGYDGRRERNLAHSIMADYFEDLNVPRGIWVAFYEDVISNYKPEDEWKITGEMINSWIYRKFDLGEEETTDESPPEQERRKPVEENTEESEEDFEDFTDEDDFEEFDDDDEEELPEEIIVAPNKNQNGDDVEDDGLEYTRGK